MEDWRISESPRSVGRGQRYRLLKPLSNDRLGSLWQGEDRIVRAPVAVRVLAPSLCRDQDAVGALRRRLAEICPRLNHPSAGRVITYNYGEDGREQFVVMEPLEGETLASRLARVGVLSLAEGAGIAARVADALQAAHGLGVVHGGLVSSSVILTTGGEVKVIDFGVAQMAAEPSTPVAPSEHVPEGSPGAHSDVRSLALMFLQMVSGHEAGQTWTAGNGQDDPGLSIPSVRKWLAPLPEHATGVLEAALGKEPSIRPAAGALAAALRLVATGQAAPSPRTEETSAVEAVRSDWAGPAPTTSSRLEAPPVAAGAAAPSEAGTDVTALNAGADRPTSDAAVGRSPPVSDWEPPLSELRQSFTRPPTRFIDRIWRGMPRSRATLAAAAVALVALVGLALSTLRDNTPQGPAAQPTTSVAMPLTPSPTQGELPSPGVTTASPPGTILVPNVVGLSALEARQSILSAGLAFAGASPVSGPPGRVVATNPRIGTAVAPGTRILVLVGAQR